MDENNLIREVVRIIDKETPHIADRDREQTSDIVSARVAVRALMSAVEQKIPWDTEFIEQTSSLIHEAWLETNNKLASNEEKLSYNNLSEEDKEKDRLYVRAAIKAYNSVSK